MGRTEKIEFEYLDFVPEPRLPVKKQIWDGTKFVPILVYRLDKTILSREQVAWLIKTVGNNGTQRPGQYWDCSKAGDFVVMDEKVYVMFQLKWSSR